MEHNPIIFEQSIVGTLQIRTSFARESYLIRVQEGNYLVRERVLFLGDHRQHHSAELLIDVLSALSHVAEAILPDSVEFCAIRHEARPDGSLFVLEIILA